MSRPARGNQDSRRVRRVHVIDATRCSIAWRCRFLTARRSQHGSVIAEKSVKNYRVHPNRFPHSVEAMLRQKRGWSARSHEAMLAKSISEHGKFDFRAGAASRHPWIEPRNCEPPAPGNDAGAVVAWCRAVGEARSSFAAHDASSMLTTRSCGGVLFPARHFSARRRRCFERARSVDSSRLTRSPDSRRSTHGRAGVGR